MTKKENKAKLYLVKNDKDNVSEIDEKTKEHKENDSEEVSHDDSLKPEGTIEEEYPSNEETVKKETPEIKPEEVDIAEELASEEPAKEGINQDTEVTDNDILAAALNELDDIDIERLENMSDDEAILEIDRLTGMNDELVNKDYLKALVNQGDRLVYYEIENIYNNEAKKTFKGRLKMRRDPPVLVIKDDYDNEAKFYLTENLTDELSETLRQVKRAYYGFHNPTDIDKPEKFMDRVKYYIKSNPFKILTTILLILFLLSLPL